MKAILINEHGNENVLYEAELETPNISPNEVLIEMKAFSLNPSDVVNREELHGAAVFPHMLGRDFVGLVKEVGPSCQSIQIGDLVTGISFEGTYAEYIKMDEQAVIKIPQEANIKEVAAFPVVAITAWAALIDYGFIQSNHNQKVLIHAGAGGVGILPFK
ncbi:quinone oxidoreductase family protein [Paenibacillus amylolyticus]|uniref:quinone oxidoreductase family protein n=1 Tax=Paenibacillus amylolyticus TaxID=1451 RepID=UPI003D964FCE